MNAAHAPIFDFLVHIMLVRRSKTLIFLYFQKLRYLTSAFNRPAFQEMLQDIQKGKIGYVVVKDLSRLGRDYITVGYYLKMFFPSKNVRFVSINDQFDTTDGITNRDKLAYIQSSTRIPLINLFNEQVSIETKMKVEVDSATFDAIQKAFQAKAYNVVPQGQSADNILKGKIICGCCGGKMQRKRGTGHADWHCFTCITKNRLGADKCTGMYAREEDIFNAIYRQLKEYVNEHYIINPAYKQQIQEYTEQIADLAKRKTTAWINAMEHYEQYVQGKSVRRNFAQYRILQIRQKSLSFRLQRARLPMKSNTPGSASSFLPVVGIFHSARLWTALIK